MVSLLAVLNFSVLINEGFPQRVPKIFSSENMVAKPWKKLKIDGRNCYGRKKDFCVFNSPSATRSLYLIGDSHIATLQNGLVKRLKDKYKIVSATSSYCWPISGFSRYTAKGKKDKRCSSRFQKNRLNHIKKTNKSILVIGGRLPLLLSTRYFDNKEGGRELNGKAWGVLKDKKGSSLEKSLRETMMGFLKQGHSIVLIYPIPEVGFDVRKKLYSERPSKSSDLNAYLEKSPITTSHEVFKNRTKSSFSLLDSIEHPNIHRVYPDKIFCSSVIEGRCITHSIEHIYYSDDDHPSLKGAELINNIVIEKIAEIEKIYKEIK